MRHASIILLIHFINDFYAMTSNMRNSPVMTSNMQNSSVITSNMRNSPVMTANMRNSLVIKDYRYTSHIGHRKISYAKYSFLLAK